MSTWHNVSRREKRSSIRKSIWGNKRRRPVDGNPDSQPVIVCLMEGLESRLLLSAAPFATPEFLLYRRSGVLAPAASTAPVGLSPSTIRQAYGIDEAVFGSVTGNGSGQTIAIVDAYNDPNIVADLHAFDAAFGLANPPSFTVIGQNGSTTLPTNDTPSSSGSWAMEIALDVEWAHVVAPAASIVLVEANSSSLTDLLAAVDTARRHAGVSVVSMSWGSSEFSSTYDSYFTTPAGHTGVTFVASSGDSGAYVSSRSLGVEWPAVSANVLSVGGTTLTTSSGTYVSESGWGNGTSSYRLGGAGGGISRYVGEPAWQKGVVTQTTTHRAVPDVAFDADPSSGVAVYDSWDSRSAPWFQVGGTSLAAPAWAGVIAIADQGRVVSGLTTMDGATQTLPMLYALPAADFHDITTGNNGYAAGPGYDLVTGRGTPIVSLLVAGLAGTKPPAPAPQPTIASLTVSPSSVTAGAGTAVTLTADNVEDPAATITSVAIYRESNGVGGLQIGSDTFVGDATQVGSTATWTLSASTAGLAVGSYTYYAQATDSASVTGSAASTVLTVLAPAPANDNFASATALSGAPVTITGTNVGATKQTGEPTVAGNAGGKSVWYTWTAAASGRVSLSTLGSSFDTLLGVYTGASVSGLSLVAGNDDASSRTLISAVTFNAVAGTTYRFVVDGYNAASGNITLNLSLLAAPANDLFASAAAISGSAATWTGTNVSAARETGEPLIAGNRGGASVWFTWTAPATATVTLNTAGSSFDTMLGVYTGSSVSALTLVAANDDAAGGGTLTSALTFHAVAGTTYRFAIDGYNGATGNIVLNLL
jgi:subtilase family serine protease